MSLVSVPTMKGCKSATLLCLLLLLAPGCRQLASYGAGSKDAALPEAGPPRDASIEGTTLEDLRVDSLDLAAPLDIGPDTTGCKEVPISLSSADNDGEIWADSFHSEGEKPTDPAEPDGIYIGNWYSGPTWAFFRFTLSTTQPRVDGVYLELWGIATTKLWDPQKHALRILLEADANAQPASRAEDRPETSMGRATLQTSQRWPGSGGLSWKIGDYNRSPDLLALLQEFINTAGLPGFEAGMTVQLWLRGDFSGDAAEVTTPYFGAPGYQPARLVLRVCE